MEASSVASTTSASSLAAAAAAAAAFVVEPIATTGGAFRDKSDARSARRVATAPTFATLERRARALARARNGATAAVIAVEAICAS
jgi:hypothetical protein